MPFIGRDWRSPGEAWVKTESFGWQRMKIIESQLYPTHHQSPACSWPPKSDYGQHMSSNCRASAGHNPEADPVSADHRLAGPTGEQTMRTGSLSSSSDTSSSTSNSRSGSFSPSPSTSPEKTTHHIHPIAISSPYGWHSCFAHHVPATAEAPNCCAKNHHNQSRSLSKESLLSADNQLQARNSTMRYNRSVSDFRNTSDLSNEEEDSELQHDNSAQNNSKTENRCLHLNPPALMKNGQSIDADTVETASVHESELDKPHRQAFKQVSCCCSGTCASSPCNFQPMREQTAPHCRISVRTREVAMYNTISEAFYRLDFCNAIHDIRRFNYICKLLHLLITQNLTSLSGCATRVLFTMLEQVAWEGKFRIVLTFVPLLLSNQIR